MHAMKLTATNPASGFTLFELLIVMLIVGVLTSIAIPSFQYVTSINRVSSEDNALLGDLQYARAEAIKEGQTVTACVANAAGTACAGGLGTAWNAGWIVFTDVNANQTVDAGDTVWRRQAAFNGTDTFVASNGVTAITFNREGFAVNVAAGTLITLHTATTNSASTRCLSVSLIGMMSVLTYNQVAANGSVCT
jgi:type IV fimbrial biogenesis protein FimT